MGCKDDVCLTFLDLVWINVVTLMSLDSVVDTVDLSPRLGYF